MSATVISGKAQMSGEANVRGEQMSGDAWHVTPDHLSPFYRVGARGIRDGVAAARQR